MLSVRPSPRSRSWLSDLLLAVALGCCIFGLCAAPGEAAAAAREGLGLCLNVIIPSLFPFFVLSTLVVELGLAEYLGRALTHVTRPLFGIGGACASALALGFIGGYPVGAKTAISLYEKGALSRTETERLLAFCNNAGPAFILGAVGAGIFASSRVGGILYLTHAAASLTVGLLFRFYRRAPAGPPRSAPLPREEEPIPAGRHRAIRLPTAFVTSVGSSFQSILGICAFVIFFTVAIKMLNTCGLLPLLARLLGALPTGLDEAAAQRLLTGLIEITSGLWSLQGAEGQLAGKLAMAAFMLGWAGVSVHCQVLTFISRSGLSAKTYLIGKLMHASLSALFTWAVVRLFRLQSPVSGYLADQVRVIGTMDFQETLTLTLLVSLLLLAGAIMLAALAALWRSRKKGKG